MKNILFFSDKLEVRKSSIHGYGVFAKSNIVKNELLEECHYIKIDVLDDNINKYKYNWPRTLKDFKYHTLPLGFACIYNSTKSNGDNNVDWDTDIINNIYVFRAIKDIEKDEELLVYYGDNYWEWFKQLNNITNK